MGAHELKEREEGTIAILGSGVLLHELLRAELVDELCLFVHPLLLGAGKRLFRELPHPTTLRLADVSSTSLGSIALRYTL
jgi:dihydrofolate reductase